MRKLIVFNMVSIDGFFAGPKGEIDWHNVDDEFNAFAIAMFKSISTIIFGRVTYDMMASYWPTEQAVQEDSQEVASIMNTIQKIVFSKTLAKAEWHNTTLIKENIVSEVKKLKEEEGKDIIILGSGTIVQQLADTDLIDEYRLMVNPLTLGNGKPLFKEKMKLHLLQTKQFDNGNVLTCYGKIRS